jgi:hypothetical protein
VLVKALEKKHEYLKTDKEHYWFNLNSFTHSGTAQLVRRIKDDNIVSNFDDKFIQQMLKFTDRYASQSYIAVADTKQ